MKNILVTGGAGYIGSHMVYHLLKNKYKVFVLDNFSNSDHTRLKKIQEDLNTKIQIIEQDITGGLENIKLNIKIDSILHFAALKSVPESLEKPIKYYKNNIYGTIQLVEWALSQNISKFVFSSTAGVYGDSQNIPIIETELKNPLSPYAQSKYFSEKILEDICKAENFNCVSLRFFNVGGNLSSGSIGDSLESPSILSSILRSHFNNEQLKIYGNDYETKDGTPVRDYIHVLDLVEAHFKSLEYVNTHEGYTSFNIGSESGSTLLELITTFEDIVGKKLNCKIVDRRVGDIGISIADCNRAFNELNWKPKKTLKNIFESMLRYYEKQGIMV